MTALSGAIWWQGGPPGGGGLMGVREVLAPHGVAETWDGDAGPCRVAVGVQQRQADAAARPAMATAADGTVVVCVDSHLHRRDELSHRLGLPAERPDAALVLAAYRRWGRSFLQELSGPFALALVDRRRGGVLLARDHGGGRFLAVHEGDGVVSFATTALALTGFPGVGHDLDMDRAVEVMLLAYATDRTFVRGVRSLLPGTAMWIDGAGSRTWRWWLPDGLPVSDAGSLAVHAAALRAQLEDAVGSVLRGADKVGIMLSGGLDSTSVAAVAGRRLAPRPLTSYTSVPPAGWSGPTPFGWIPSERSAVEALSSAVPNLVPRFVDAPTGSLFGHYESLWELGCPPVRNPLNMIWVFICYQMAAAEGIDVLLTGGAGNLAFSADGPQWLFELARRGRFIRLAREASSFADAFHTDVAGVLRRDVLAHLLPGLRRRRALRNGTDPLATWLGATAIRPDRLAGVDLGAVLPELIDPDPIPFTRDTARLFLGVGAQAELESAVHARWGIELRDPTIDRRLVELALTQPEWWRRHNGEWRAICRAAMRDVLPAEIVDRATLGAQQPDWLDRLTAARDEVVEELDAVRGHPASCEVIDVERLDRLVAAWPERSRAADNAVINDYQLALPRALFLSRYLRWFEERAGRVRRGGPAVVGAGTIDVDVTARG